MAHALALPIIIEMEENTRRTLYKCLHVQSVNRPTWVNDGILLVQWLSHALIPAIVSKMVRNTRKNTV